MQSVASHTTRFLKNGVLCAALLLGSLAHLVLKQDFIAIKTMADASDQICSVSSNGHLFAAASADAKVRVYDTEQDSGDG